jgi:hypothetical protein
MRNFLIFIVLGLLVSCATLGSKTTIYDHSRLNDIKTIGIITKRFSQPKNSYHQLVKESFTKALLEGIREREMFKIIILDTTENENLNLLEFSIPENVDAILLAEWKLANPGSMVSNARVNLSIIDKQNKKVILTSSHGTNLGNSYWWTPALPKTLLDAVEGALNTMNKKLTVQI